MKLHTVGKPGDFNNTSEGRMYAQAIEQRVEGGQQLMALRQIAAKPGLNTPKL